MNSRYDMPQTRYKARKSNFPKVLLVLILLAAALALTNPVKSDFSKYALNNLEDSIGISIGEGVSSLVGEPVVESFTLRDNYILFSVFSLPDVQNSKFLTGDVTAAKRYLGLFKIIFIKL
ncbi:hypothetical protein [Paenibacillus sp. MMS20-IR301]|uniref:hypothetical protein n=1 Tax=Paenibacillus sp. MMS20-IR301 TaxID=2895946 RepID=UPI0028EA9B47|nr:hypothetical protein [Paenibacillus sp. MMS20-IR301]WNS44974.1 hypothetical protein LOS79_06800 [Paenibacillus sp. MMS20-IR301]